MTKMRRLLPAMIAGCVLCFAAHASDAPLTINEIINATNFIVANQCSGTLISLKYRLVLTNDHCLEGYVDKIEKEETGKEGEVKKVTREVFRDMELKQKSYKDFDEVSAATFQAQILFHSAKFDLALLRIKADRLPMTIYSHVLPEAKPVARGDRVYVVGNPHMLDANLNEGVVSSVTRTIHWDETNEDVHYYGIDAGVNPGNSGGALYNSDLMLIGVPGAGMRGATGLGFAIPAPTIRRFLSDHCYADVWNDAVQAHDACEKDKLDKANEIRVKAGLPPLDQPKEERDGLRSADAVIHATSLELKPEAKAAPPLPTPAQNEKPLSRAILEWVDSWGLVRKD